MSKSKSTSAPPAEKEQSSLVRRGGRNDEPVNFDELGHDTQLLGLVRVISRAEPPMVIGVHGDWGTGKTSFMKVLQALLGKKTRGQYRKIEEGAGITNALADRAVHEIEGAPREIPRNDIMTVWFNPWEHQFEDEPVMPLLDAIRHQQPSRWSKLTSKLKRVVEDPKFRIMGKAALGVAKMVGPGWFTALSRQIGDEAREVMDSFSQFSSEFEASMEELTRQSGGRLVIFIDDLDRCKAGHVVKILEALKLHLLNKHCIFVLGCADERVRACLMDKKMGLGLDEQAAREYIEKIVQLPVYLPPVWAGNFRTLLTHLEWGRFAQDDRCFGLLRAFAGDNPRRLKRFLTWYGMERTMVELADGLADSAGPFYEDEAMFLKIKLLQFAEPRKYKLPADFRHDREKEGSKEPQGEPVKER